MPWPESPFPRDAAGLLKLLGLLFVGLPLFLAARITGSAILLVVFAIFVAGALGWLYWRDRSRSR